jgi:hypothetical protein
MSFPIDTTRRRDPKFGKGILAWGCAILLFCLSGPGLCQENGIALMLDVSPVEGGSLNLSPGVHNYDMDTPVTLTATPKPGYQFVYWMGDVADATASTTMVYIDSPKIVIAIFERTKFELAVFEEAPQPSRGRGGLIPKGSDYAAGLEQAGGGRRPPKFHFPQIPQPNEDLPVPEAEEDLPVPETEGDFPVPIPEPATIAFLLIGMLTLVGTRRRQVKMH